MKEKDDTEDSEAMEKEKERVKEKRKLSEELKEFVYIGETSRSAMERGK